MPPFERHVQSQTEKCRHKMDYIDFAKKVCQLGQQHDDIVKKAIPALECKIQAATTAKSVKHLERMKADQAQKAARLLTDMTASRQTAMKHKQTDITAYMLALEGKIEYFVSRALIQPPQVLRAFKQDLHAKLVAKHQKLVTAAHEELLHWVRGEYTAKFDAGVKKFERATVD